MLVRKIDMGDSNNSYEIKPLHRIAYFGFVIEDYSSKSYKTRNNEDKCVLWIFKKNFHISFRLKKWVLCKHEYKVWTTKQKNRLHVRVNNVLIAIKYNTPTIQSQLQLQCQQMHSSEVATCCISHSQWPTNVSMTNF